MKHLLLMQHMQQRVIVQHYTKGEGTMKMIRVSVQLPAPLKAKVDAQRERGASASWFIRKLVEQHFKGKKAA